MYGYLSRYQLNSLGKKCFIMLSLICQILLSNYEGQRGVVVSTTD